MRPSDPPRYACRGNPIDLNVLDRRRPATELTGSALQALSDPVMRVPDLHTWWIADATDEEVGLIRPAGPGRYEYRSIRRGPTGGLMSHGWGALTNTEGEVRRILPGLADADLALDPAALPGSASTRLHLLVTEQSCASGRPATGRVRLVQVTWHPDRLDLLIGVEPLPGFQRCPGNPPTPYVVDLDAPLGDRTVCDGAAFPPRPARIVVRRA